ncbi:hypothetical protein PC123_g18637 [Phytophthora cactorum]|nr:hypothetical protein PC123_g18637 [Phytophthora cactorum]
MKALWPPLSTSPLRLVVTDRFYTSVKLALKLLHRRMHITGTIQTKMAGYAKGVKTEKKVKTVNGVKELDPPSGTIKLAKNKQFPQITAAMWMDRNPVHMLSSGGSRKLVPINRRIRGEMQTLQAPELVRDYHRYTGGVDVYDQLRMQRYSVQLSYKTCKYYKALILGLVDMALVSAFIVFRHNKKVNGERPPKHYEFFETLMEQLIAVDAETFESIERVTCAEDRTVASPARSTTSRQDGQCTDAQIDEGHTLAENPDTADTVQDEKKRQRTCKVCALQKSKPRKYTKVLLPGMLVWCDSVRTLSSLLLPGDAEANFSV